MAIPTWTPGEVLASADVNSWFVPLAAYKASDTSRTSTTTLANDPDLTLAVAANCVYTVDLYLDFDGDTTGTGDLKLGWAVPASTTMRYGAAYDNTSPAASCGTTFTQASTISAATNGAGVLQSFSAKGTIITSAAAGNVVLKWAQNTSNPTATIIHAQSYLTARRIA
jgi:hypothetical protein